MANMAEKLGFDAVPFRLVSGKSSRVIGACKGCSRCSRIYDFSGVKVCNCELTHAVVLPLGCSLRDKDISGERVCVNCRHFLGGCDYGLSCGKEYHRLVDPLDEACDEFERKQR